MLIRVLAFALMVPSAALAQGPTEQLLIQMKHELGDAYVNRDPSTLERIYTDDYTVIDDDGRMRTKADELRDLQSGDRRYEQATYDDITVRLYGDAAVLSGRGTVKGSRGGTPFHTEYRSSNVYVRRNGVWKIAWAHISASHGLLANPPAQMPSGISRAQIVDNATVMCARLTYAPGAAETSHTHPFSAVVIQLTPGEADMTIGGERTRARRDAGFVWYIPRGVAHALVNAGTDRFEQITIAIKPDRAPAPPAPATPAPPGITRTTVLDNADARVVRVEFSPAGREPVHEHPGDLVTVELTPGRIEILLGTVRTVADSPAGEVRFLPRNVPHAYASAAPAPFTLFSVTIK